MRNSESRQWFESSAVWNLELNDHEVESGIQYRESRLQDCLGLPYMKQILLAAKWFFFIENWEWALPANPFHENRWSLNLVLVILIYLWRHLARMALWKLIRHGGEKGRQLKMVSQTVASSSVTANFCVHCDKGTKPPLVNEWSNTPFPSCWFPLRVLVQNHSNYNESSAWKYTTHFHLNGCAPGVRCFNETFRSVFQKCSYFSARETVATIVKYKGNVCVKLGLGLALKPRQTKLFNQTSHELVFKAVTNSKRSG